jgi:hypothetical protein
MAAYESLVFPARTLDWIGDATLDLNAAVYRDGLGRRISGYTKSAALLTSCNRP